MTCLYRHRRSCITSLTAVEELLLYLAIIVFCVSHSDIVFTWSNPTEHRLQHCSVFFTYKPEFFSINHTNNVPQQLLYTRQFEHSSAKNLDDINSFHKRITWGTGEGKGEWASPLMCHSKRYS